MNKIVSRTVSVNNNPKYSSLLFSAITMGILHDNMHKNNDLFLYKTIHKNSQD